MAAHRLESNKIHNLPVQINYTLPTSTPSETFITLLPSLHQVYVHRAGDPGEEECWGSIYLKTVISGVLHASPELHPSNRAATDLSLYILDPRETYLRRDRFPQPQTRDSASSQPLNSSPAVQGSSEIWSGKGLVSWALDEPGLGKTLIIGRLVRNGLFGSLGRDDVGGLEGLLRAGKGIEGWGIEISMGLRAGGGIGATSSTNSLAVQAGMDLRRAIKSSPVRVQSRDISQPRYVDTTHMRVPITAPRPLSPARIVSITQNTKARQPPSHAMTTNASPSSSKLPPLPLKKTKPSPPTHSQSYPVTTRPRVTSSSSRRVSNHDLSSVSSLLSSDPASLTQEEGHRLLNHPVVVRALQGLPGKGRKRKAGNAEVEATVKRVKVEEDVEGLKEVEEARRCWTCGRTNSAVWRTKDLPDGRVATLCNACGRKDLISAPRIDSGFKRSLSTVVEQDAQRIAALRAVAVPSLSRLKEVTRPGTMTSPVRGGGAIKRWDGGRSSPGPAHLPPRYAQQTQQPQPPKTPPSSSVSTRAARRRQAVVEESPNTAIRKILAYTNMPSLDLPLSDDDKPRQGQLDAPMDIDLGLDVSQSQDTNYEWSDLSAFFDIDGGYGPSPHAQTDQTVPMATSDFDNTSDDVLSQLFTRDGSVGSVGGGGGFDFSQLPPSSPRFGDLEFEMDGFDWASMSHVGGGQRGSCSELLMSSPEEEMGGGGLGRGIGVGVGVGLTPGKAGRKARLVGRERVVDEVKVETGDAAKEADMDFSFFEEMMGGQ